MLTFHAALINFFFVLSIIALVGILKQTLKFETNWVPVTNLFIYKQICLITRSSSKLNS